MHNISRVLILFALVISGCNPVAASTPTETAEPTAIPELLASPTSESAVPSQAPAATEKVNSSLFQFHEENPVLPHRARPSWDSQFIDPGAMVYHQGQFHMFFNGISRFPAPVGVGYATSIDGFEWTRQSEEPVLSAEAMNSTNLLGSNLFVTSALVEPD
ncbi:MAG TPA: hypothetical protein VHO49_20645, partial [Anaerolineales bacterium]|nr:hypothetical protein [Anaerolineales bacterium]